MKLAQSLYMTYTEELMQTIRNDEAEFIKTYQDIADVQAGKRDGDLVLAGGGDLKKK